MGAALKLITDDLAGALTKALHEPRLGDIPDLRGRFVSLQNLIGLDVTPATPVSVALARLHRAIRVQESHRARGKQNTARLKRDWAYDPNTLLALQSYASLIEESRPCAK